MSSSTDAAALLAAAHARVGRPAPRRSSSSAPLPPPAATEEEPRANGPEDIGFTQRPLPRPAARPAPDPYPGAKLDVVEETDIGWRVRLWWPGGKGSDHYGKTRADAESNARAYCARRAKR